MGCDKSCLKKEAHQGGALISVHPHPPLHPPLQRVFLDFLLDPLLKRWV